MADEMKPRAVCGRIAPDRLPVPAQRAGLRWQQTRHQSQQARFAAAIGAGEDERAARLEREIEAAKDQPLPAAAGEGVTGEQGHGTQRERGRKLERRLRRRAKRSRREGLGGKPVRASLTSIMRTPECAPGSTEKRQNRDIARLPWHIPSSLREGPPFSKERTSRYSSIVFANVVDDLAVIGQAALRHARDRAAQLGQ